MTSCKNCFYENGDADPFCIVCKYPITGSEQEKARFISSQVMTKNDVEHAIQKVRYTRIALFALSGILFGLTLLLVVFYGFRVLTSPLFILAVLYFISAFISRKRPLTGMSIALALTVSLYVLQFAMSPLALAEGIFWKCIILIVILYGFSAVLSANKKLKSNPYVADMLGYKNLARLTKTEMNSEILDHSL